MTSPIAWQRFAEPSPDLAQASSIEYDCKTGILSKPRTKEQAVFRYMESNIEIPDQWSLSFMSL